MVHEHVYDKWILPLLEVGDLGKTNRIVLPILHFIIYLFVSATC